MNNCEIYNEKVEKNNKIGSNKIIRVCVIALSVIGLITFFSLLFPQIRQLVLDLAEQITNKEILGQEGYSRVILQFAIGGICTILLFSYCSLTESGRSLACSIKQEIKECLLEINFRSLLKPGFLIFIVYLLGTLTIIRANFSYMDDLGRSIDGYRHWHYQSRYLSELASIFIHADTNLTDISPLPQLLAVLFLTISSVLLVYIICNKKVTVIKLLASVPLGLSPFFLECLSYKFDAPYMALSILSSIIPFLFIARKKAFFFCSIVSVLIMCMTYQAASGVYMLVAVILCFQDWNSRKKTNKDILQFLGISVLSFCFALAIYKFVIARPSLFDLEYFSSAMHPLPVLFPETFNNIKIFSMVIVEDLGITWKVGIVLVCFFFIIKSIFTSKQNKLFSFLISIIFIIISFIISYGIYSLLTIPLFIPRTLYGFGVFLSILCIYIVTDYKNIAKVIVLALNWSFLVFAFSYGNALADQARYEEFRAGLLLSDLSSLFPDIDKGNMYVNFENTIDSTPLVKNIEKRYPIIKKLANGRFGGTTWGNYFFKNYNISCEPYFKHGSNLIDTESFDPPVVLDSYYHTIKSNGVRVLIILKH